MNRWLRWIWLLVVAAMPAFSANVWYVSTNGVSSNSGTLESPWDLKTALQKTGSVGAGDTIYVRGGYYEGPRRYPPYYIGAGETFDYDLNDREFYVTITSGGGSEIRIRPYEREIPHVHGGFFLASTVEGVWIQGLHIYHTYTSVADRTPIEKDPGPHPRACSFPDDRSNNRLINCIIDNMTHPAVAMQLSGTADDVELYGNIVLATGVYDNRPGEGAMPVGSAVYAQHESGNDLMIEQNIFGWTMRDTFYVYTEGGYVNSVTLKNNVGWTGNDRWSAAPLYTWTSSRDSVYLVDSKDNAATGIVLHGNHAYGHTRFGETKNNPKHDIQLTNNVIATVNENDDSDGVGIMLGSFRDASRYWEHINVNNNWVVSETWCPIAWYNSADAISYSLSNNKWYSSKSDCFVLEGVGDEFHTLAEWQGYVGDAGSTYSSSLPAANWISAYTNKYEAKRLHAVVWNWSGATSQTLDLSTNGWSSGDSYTVYDAQNPLVAVSSGTYSGSPITLPLNLTATIPIYYMLPNVDTNHTHTLFNAFLVTGESGTVPTISLNVSSLTATNWVGTDATSTTFTIQNIGGGTLTYNIATNETWVQVSPASGTSTGEADTITVTYTGTGALPAGDASALITIAASGASNTPQTADVNHHAETRPIITIQPSTNITQTVTLGSDALQQSFWVNNYSGGPWLNITNTDNVAWLSVDPTSASQNGSASWNQRIDINYSTAALSAGVYNGVITITDANASNNPQYVYVGLEVLNPESPPFINKNLSALTPSVLFGNNAASQTFEVWNVSGASQLNYAITDDQAWLSESPASGSSLGEHDTITVSYDTAALAEGPYSATITITDAAASNSPQTISVSLTVTNTPVDPTPTIGKSTSAITQSVIVGSVAGSQTFQVWSGTTAALNYVITDSVDWLSCAPGSGSSTGEFDTITITYDTATVPVGVYTGTITITDAAASNNPQTIGVTLTVQNTPQTVQGAWSGGIRRQ